MISKERLEELIEQEAIIYQVYADVSVIETKLDKTIMKIGFEGRGTPLDKLFENKYEAEWFKEFGCIERVERLELPTWEEFNKGIEIYFRDDLGMAYSLNKTQFTDRPNIIYLLEEGIQGDYILKKYDLTKENYTLACRKAKELFLGESEKELHIKYPYHYSEEYILNNRKLKAENQSLKNNWQELRKYVEKLYNKSEVISEDLFFIREKIQELEKGGNNE